MFFNYFLYWLCSSNTSNKLWRKQLGKALSFHCSYFGGGSILHCFLYSLLVIHRGVNLLLSCALIINCFHTNFACQFFLFSPLCSLNINCVHLRSLNVYMNLLLTWEMNVWHDNQRSSKFHIVIFFTMFTWNSSLIEECKDVPFWFFFFFLKLLLHIHVFVLLAHAK